MGEGDRVSADYKSGFLVPNNPLGPIDAAQIIADTAYVGRNMVIQVQNFGKTIIEAEQQFGAMLKEIFPSKVNIAYKVNLICLEDYGISLNESMRARALYDYPGQVNEAIDETIEMGEEIKLRAECRAGGLLEEQVRERWETDKYLMSEAKTSKLKLSERRVDLNKPSRLEGLLIWE